MEPHKAIRTARAKSGMSSAKLAGIIGVTPSAMSRYESGERKIPKDVISKIADALQISVDDLLSISCDENLDATWKNDSGIGRKKRDINIVIGQNIRDARLRSGLTQSAVSNALGVTPPTVVRYENGGASISAEVLVKLCSILNIGADELLGINFSPSGWSATLTKSEKTLVSGYRELDSYGQNTVNVVLAAEAKRVEKLYGAYGSREDERSAPGQRYIKMYTMASAAGYNAPLDNDEYKMIPVSKDTPREADYAVPISGNSMEPYINDGDIVYVKRTGTSNTDVDFRNGEIGIFSVDGSLYCKHFFRDERGDIYLISSNEECKESNLYISADSDSTLVAHGKVILRDKPKLPRYFLNEFALV